MTGNRGNVRSLVIIILLGIIVYSNTFGNSFLWDDEVLVVKNSYIKNWKHLPHLFTRDLFYGRWKLGNYYRPLQSLSYLTDYSLYELNPAGYHLTNLLFHLFNAILIYGILNLIQKNKKVSLLTALLFVVHPIHTQAVTYISGRADPMVAFFIFSGFYLYIRSIDLDKKTYYFASLALFVFALLTKEIAIVFPFLLLLYDFVFPRRSRAKTEGFLKYRYFTLFLILGLYVALRYSVLNFAEGVPSLGSAGLSSRLLSMPRVIFAYLGLLFLPLGLHMEREVPLANSLLEPSVLLSLILLILIGITIVRTYRHSRIIFFASVWFFLALLPMCNIMPLTTLMSEHWLYIASLGFFMILAIGLAALSELKIGASRKFWRIFVLLSAIAIFAFYSFLTLRRNLDWKDGLTLCRNTLKYSPGNERVHNNLGNIYLREGRHGKAEDEYREALKLDPYLSEAYHNLGIIYSGRKEYDRAIEEYKEALKLNPGLLETHYNLGIVYYKQGEKEMALSQLKEALRLFPGNEDIIEALERIKEEGG